MNKADLVRAVADSTGFTRKDAGRAVEAIFTVIQEALRRGEKVSLVGFGGFEVRSRRARQGRNPRTGRVISIQSRKVPFFRAGKPLKKAVNG
jgi:DNA-binding protein HU-beta